MNRFYKLMNSFKALGLVFLLAPSWVMGQVTIFSENMGTPTATTAITANTFQNSATLTYSNGGAATSADVRNTTTSSTYSGASAGGNVFFTTTSGVYGFSIESINAASFSSLTLQFGYRKESATLHATFSVDYWDGSAWVTVANTSGALFNETTTAATGWYLSKTLSLPVGAQIAGLKIRFVKSGTASLRLDDVILKGTAITPSIALSSPSQVAAGNVGQGAANQPISNFQAAITVANATLNTMAFVTGGTYSASDITNFRLYYNASANTFGSAVQIGTSQASVASGATVTFSTLATTISTGSTGYFWITASTAPAATIGNTINAAASPTLTFAAGTPTGSITAGGAQTIAGCSPIDVTAAAGSAGNMSSVLTWTNPPCYDEILIVAATAANTGMPTGDGTSYTGNLAYGSGTALGIGFVVYKGSTSSQNVTALTNGTPYFFKFFTRKGTVWSTGTEINATPVLATVATDYFRSIATGDWASASTWESSPDNSLWIPATATPSATATAITIRNGQTITISTAVTMDDVTIASGGTLVVATGGIVNLSNGAATNDLDVQNGGVLQFTSSTTYVTVFVVATGALVNVATGGKVTIGNGVGVGGAYNSLATSTTTTTWNDGSIFEWNSTTTPSANNVIYFPNAGSNVPILRVSAAWGTPGGSGTTVINGKIEVNVSFSWFSTGTKTFRNGIIGTATMTQTTGPWVISGPTAEIGGNVTLALAVMTVPTNPGLTINTGVTLTGTGTATLAGAGFTSLKSSATLNNLVLSGSNLVLDDATTLTVNGTLTLTTGNISLGTTGTGNVIAGTVSGGSSTSYIVTNGTGVLTQIIPGTITKTFPVGVTSYDPVSITLSGVITEFATFGVGVKDALSNPLGSAVTNPGLVVKRQWDVSRTGNANPVSISFTSAATCIDGSATRPGGGTGMIGHWNGSAWDDFAANYATNTWSIASYAGGFSPFIVASLGAVLSVEFQNITAKNKGTANVVNWSTASEKNNAYFDVQHATNGLDFQTIGTVKGNGTINTVSNYSYEHATPTVGTNYYRLRQVDVNGAESFSKVVSVQNGGKKGTISVYPTLATDKLNVLNVEETATYSIFNLLGQNVQIGQLNGQNELIISKLSAGTYILKVGNSSVKFFKN
jgi:hypothetical protein